MSEPRSFPLSGVWMPTRLRALYYGRDSVEKYLLASLPTPASKAFIVTGSSLANKTTLIKDVERYLGPDRHAGTFSSIAQFAPVAQLDEAANLVQQNPAIDTIISVGGGSPIDAAKAISYRLNQIQGKYLYHITIPTTISAAECTSGAGYTDRNGFKTSVAGIELTVNVIIYDSKFALETPQQLWLSTGMRSVDHAMELMYNSGSSEITRLMALQAASNLFIYLPKYKEDPKNEEYITQLQLAAFTSLGLLGYAAKAPLGLSHVLGYSVSSPYGIPHGVTSCITLGHVIGLKANDPAAAQQIARMLPFLGHSKSGDDKKDAEMVADQVLSLVDRLGLTTTLTKYGVSQDEVPVIVKRATGLESGPDFEAICQLVKTLY